jgi:hypothetical protein
MAVPPAEHPEIAAIEHKMACCRTRIRTLNETTGFGVKAVQRIRRPSVKGFKNVERILAEEPQSLFTKAVRCVLEITPAE